MKKPLLLLSLMILSMCLLLMACKGFRKETFNFGSNEYGNYLIYEKDGKFVFTPAANTEQEAEGRTTTQFSSESLQKN